MTFSFSHNHPIRRLSYSLFALLGFVMAATNMGWGSGNDLEKLHAELDEKSVRNWILFRRPETKSLVKIRAQSSTFHDTQDVSIQIFEQGPSIISYSGAFDHSKTSLKDLTDSIKVPAHNLVKALGIKKEFYDDFIGDLRDDNSFPLSIINNYNSIEKGHELISRIARDRHGPKDVYSIVGGPIAAVGALRLLVELEILSNGDPLPRIHLNIFGYLPKYTREFLEKVGIDFTIVHPDVDGGFLSKIDIEFPKAAKMIKSVCDEARGKK